MRTSQTTKSDGLAYGLVQSIVNEDRPGAGINTTVGDLGGNVDLMVRSAAQCGRSRRRIWSYFPELSVTGYPPRDLVEKPSFVERSERELERLAAETAALTCSL